jgi:hypothetical protein
MYELPAVPEFVTSERSNGTDPLARSQSTGFRPLRRRIRRIQGAVASKRIGLTGLSQLRSMLQELRRGPVVVTVRFANSALLV